MQATKHNPKATDNVSDDELEDRSDSRNDRGASTSRRKWLVFPNGRSTPSRCELGSRLWAIFTCRCVHFVRSELSCAYLDVASSRPVTCWKIRAQSHWRNFWMLALGILKSMCMKNLECLLVSSFHILWQESLLWCYELGKNVSLPISWETWKTLVVSSRSIIYLSHFSLSTPEGLISSLKYNS